MKTKKTVLLLLLGISVLGSVGLVSKHLKGPAAETRERKVLFYQDSMHPWIKSDHPGKCTVCAMELTPIYEGASGLQVSDKTIVLNSNNITVLNVQTEKVRLRSLQRTLRIAGTLEASETSKRVIVAGKAGRIERLAVPYAGFEIAQGQPLANFFVPELLAEARRYVLLARPGARGQTHDADLNNPLLSTLQNLRLFGLTDSQIEHLATTGKAEASFELLAPLSGAVTERNVSEGQFVSEGTRLFTIVDLSLLWFRFDAYEQDLPWLQAGQIVEFSVPTAPGRLFSGPIAFIEPLVNETTRAAKVRVDVENPAIEINGLKQRLLRQQLYAEGRVRIETPARLVIPASAVLCPGGQAYAYVDLGSGAYEIRQLKLGRRGDDCWEVLAGLDDGEDIVTSGNVLIDAQAQFNRAVSSADTTPSPHHSIPPLSSAQQKALTEFLAAAHGVSAALAADRLDELKPHLAALPGLVAALQKTLGPQHAWQPTLERIQSFPLPTPSSLAAARELFLPFSTNVVELVQALRLSHEAYGSLKVYQCPMAPKPGLWFQAQGPLRNPYFGAEMLSCGREIKSPASAGEAKSPILVKTSAPVAPSIALDGLGASLSKSVTPAPPAAVSVSSRPTPTAARLPASPQVQPLDSRDHSVFENRMKSALAVRFASRASSGTNTPTSPAAPAPRPKLNPQ